MAILANFCLIRSDSRVPFQKEDKKETSRSMKSAIAKPRPMSLVCRTILSERNNLSQNLSDSNRPENAKVEQGGVSSSVGKLTRNTSLNPGEQSQVRRHEDTQHAESSHSSSIWDWMRGVETHKDMSKMEFQNMQIFFQN